MSAQSKELAEAVRVLRKYGHYVSYSNGGNHNGWFIPAWALKKQCVMIVIDLEKIEKSGEGKQ